MQQEHHVIARIRPNGTVLMQHVITNPRMKDVHQTTFQVNDSLEVTIWWPERLRPEMETAQNESCVQAIRERLSSSKRPRSSDP